MKLSTVVSLYVDHHRALGQRFRSEEHLLRSFCRMIGDRPFASIPAPSVLAFLDGHGPITEYWAKKHRVLTGLYRFALARGLVGVSPLPRRIRKPSIPAFVPYVYSPAELKRLLAAVPTACGRRAFLDDYVLRALLLLLYGAGLRLGEALALRLGDVDLSQAILQIRETKFHKTRLVPMGRDLAQVLTAYVARRNDAHAATADAPLFCLRDGSRLSQSAARSAFRRLRALAGIRREGGTRRQPRLHDLRHTAAAHRLIAWYRSGIDLQDLLPKLATYLGHVDLCATQRYLTMTAELLQEASLRFEHYAMESRHD